MEVTILVITVIVLAFMVANLSNKLREAKQINTSLETMYEIVKKERPRFSEVIKKEAVRYTELREEKDLLQKRFNQHTRLKVSSPKQGNTTRKADLMIQRLFNEGKCQAQDSCSLDDENLLEIITKRLGDEHGLYTGKGYTINSPVTYPPEKGKKTIYIVLKKPNNE